DGTFELLIGPDVDPADGIRLEPDAVCAITRDYLADPEHDRRAEWRIEALDRPATLPPDRRRPGPALPRCRDVVARPGRHRPHPARGAQHHRRALPGAA